MKISQAVVQTKKTPKLQQFRGFLNNRNIL